EDLVAHERAETAFGEQIDLTSKEGRQSVLSTDQFEEPHWSVEVDDDVHIGARASVAARGRAEHPQAADAVAPGEISQSPGIELDHAQSFAKARGRSMVLDPGGRKLCQKLIRYPPSGAVAADEKSSNVNACRHPPPPL